MPLPLLAAAAPVAAGAAANVGQMAVSIVGDARGLSRELKSVEKLAKTSGARVTQPFKEISDTLETAKGKASAFGNAVQNAVSLILGPSEVLNSVIGAMNSIWGAMGDQIVANLMPAIRPFIELLLDLNREVLPELLPILEDLAKQFGEEIGPILKDFVVPAAKEFAIALADIFDAMRDAGIFEIAKGAIIVFAVAVSWAAREVEKLADQIRTLQRLWEDLQRSMSAAGGGLTPVSPGLGGGDWLSTFFSIVNPLR